jgi:hypothetical protein
VLEAGGARGAALRPCPLGTGVEDLLSRSRRRRNERASAKNGRRSVFDAKKHLLKRKGQPQCVPGPPVSDLSTPGRYDRNPRPSGP